MENSNQFALHKLIKLKTMELHEKAHEIPYIKNLLKDNVQKESLVGHLRAFAIIYGTLEHHLERFKANQFEDFLSAYTPKLPLLLKDLEKIKASEVMDIIPAVSNALSIADRIMIYSIKSPWKLIGFIYTLDGSLNGGSIFKKHFSKILNLEDGDYLSFFSVFDIEFKQFWKNFTDSLNSELLDPNTKNDITSGAEEIFYDLMKIYESLYPVDSKYLGNHITALNPEAGNYPVSTNPVEIKCAISAGIKCWEEFPFYEKRYGERGRRFAVSDSAWLVTLSDLPVDLAVKQVKWLANYLAKIGMPTITMEAQLKYLYLELAKAIPEKETKYKSLLLASDELRGNILKIFSDNMISESNHILIHYLINMVLILKKLKIQANLFAALLLI
ncbi:MAG: biliverdin-producing heme oxygenase [Prolixibacteraceae bacterium]|nr:biliverdin-producing heme oxygenase [Prolixibacteraceae bacterium]